MEQAIVRVVTSRDATRVGARTERRRWLVASASLLRFRRPVPLLAAMTLAVTLVSAVAYLRARDEAGAALEDFGHAQSLIARGLALAVDDAVKRAGTGGVRLRADPTALAVHLAEAVGHPLGLIVGLRPPGARRFFRSDGPALELARLSDAADAARDHVTLVAADAERLGLPARLAVAGLAYSAAGPAWTVAVVSSAARERDRERQAGSRLLISILIAAGLVGGFGGIALATQRKEMALERELALSGLRREGDARLDRLGRVAMLGTLSMGVAHEMATPLGVIAVRAEQLAEALGEDGRRARAVQVIQDQCERMRQIIRGLLTLARGGEPELREMAPEQLAREATELVEHRFTSAGVRLVYSSPSIATAVQVDPPLLVQALVNLLLNACDASQPQGSVRLEVRPDGAGICFSVTDHGPGVPEAVTQRLAEPLLTTKPATAGTGLGLAIVSEIVKSHRGHFSLAAAPGGGTMATIVLPRPSSTTERAT